MKALILTGGYGKRLAPLTWFTPKPMIKVEGKPVLEHIVEHLESFGVEEIIINLHYKPKHFMNHFKNRVLYTYEPKLLGEEGTIRSIKHWFRNDYLLVQNGDTLTDLNILTMFTWADGRNIRYMDRQTYAGVRIVGPEYREGQSEVKYYDPGASWLDVGTHESLAKAKEYVQKLNYMREVRNRWN